MWLIFRAFCATGTHRLTLKTVWENPHTLAQQLAAAQNSVFLEQSRNAASGEGTGFSPVRSVTTDTSDDKHGTQHSVTDKPESGNQYAGDERQYAYQSEEGVHQHEDDEYEDYEEYAEQEEEEDDDEEDGRDEHEGVLNRKNAIGTKPGRRKNASAQSRTDPSDRSDSEERRLKRNARMRLAESRALVEEKRRSAELQVKQQETERKYLEAMVKLERLQAVRKQEMKRCAVAFIISLSMPCERQHRAFGCS